MLATSTVMMIVQINGYIHLIYLCVLVAVLQQMQVQVEGQLIQLQAANGLTVDVTDPGNGLLSVNQNSNPDTTITDITSPTYPPTRSPTNHHPTQLPSNRPTDQSITKKKSTPKPTKLPKTMDVKKSTKKVKTAKAVAQPPTPGPTENGNGKAATGVAQPPTPAPTGNDNEQCVNFRYPNMKEKSPLDICFKVTLFGLGNGRWRFMNGTVITNPIDFDNNYSIIDHNSWEIIYVFNVKRTGNKTKFIGLLNGPPCQSHSFCGNDLYSADCTNLKYGRNVTCEPLSELFFPFIADAALKPVVANPTRSPV